MNTNALLQLREDNDYKQSHLMQINQYLKTVPDAENRKH